MVTFEIDLDDLAYERMCREIKMLRLIDDIDISRSSFISLAVFISALSVQGKGNLILIR